MEKLMRRRNQQKSDFSFSQMVPSISVALRWTSSKLRRIVDSYEINCRIVRHEIYRHVYPCVSLSIAQ